MEKGIHIAITLHKSLKSCKCSDLCKKCKAHYTLEIQIYSITRVLIDNNNTLTTNKKTIITKKILQQRGYESLVNSTPQATDTKSAGAGQQRRRRGRTSDAHRPSDDRTCASTQCCAFCFLLLSLKLLSLYQKDVIVDVQTFRSRTKTSHNTTPTQRRAICPLASRSGLRCRAATRVASVPAPQSLTSRPRPKYHIFKQVGQLARPQVKVPLLPCEHYYLHTKPIENLDPMTPGTYHFTFNVKADFIC